MNIIASPPLASSVARTSAINGRLWGMRANDWSRLQEGQMRTTYDVVLARAGVEAGTNILDVGCGSGLAARVAADLGAKVTGLDAAPALLNIARQRTPQGEFIVGEAEELPFPDCSFDLVTGFNAFQYAASVLHALREARRVTRIGGQLLIMVWGRPEGMQAAQLVGALRPLVPPPPPGAPGPFALSDESTLRAVAADAGWIHGEIFDAETTWVYSDLAQALCALKSSGVAARAIEHAGEVAVDTAHAGVLAKLRQPDGTYRVGATFRCLLARAA